MENATTTHAILKDFGIWLVESAPWTHAHHLWWWKHQA